MSEVCLESDLCSQHFSKFSDKVKTKLTNFCMAQRALSLALLEAKPLGTCKITTSISPETYGVSTSIEGLKEMSL